MAAVSNNVKQFKFNDLYVKIAVLCLKFETRKGKQIFLKRKISMYSTL